MYIPTFELNLHWITCNNLRGGINKFEKQSANELAVANQKSKEYSILPQPPNKYYCEVLSPYVKKNKTKQNNNKKKGLAAYIEAFSKDYSRPYLNQRPLPKPSSFPKFPHRHLPAAW